MRKRKRGCGTYVDEETGDITPIQTTKEAKRNHKKSGKWYREPTEAELRLWDRDDKRKALVERANRREENKKLNAIERAEREAKERDEKRRLFEVGKISFTQTLAKKDEDQLNLHSWFGGRPSKSKLKTVLPKAECRKHGARQDEDKENDECGDAADESEELRNLSQESQDGDSEESSQAFSDHKSKPTDQHDMETMVDLQKTLEADGLDQFNDVDLMLSSQAFDVAEDSDAETAKPEPRPDQVEQDSLPTFKVPAIPERVPRLPLSPMSQSDVNVRASQALQVCSFKAKLEKAEISRTPSTQVVRDLLSNICTQDLEDDLEEDDFDEDKENQEPDEIAPNDHHDSPTKVTKPYALLNQVECAPSDPQQDSFTSTGSFNYDDAFAEITAVDGDIEDNSDRDSAEHEDFLDDLDDATLLSELPSTQFRHKPPFTAEEYMAMQTQRPSQHPRLQSSAKTISASPSQPSRSRVTKKALQKFDSFADPGLSDDDLLEGLEEYERSQTKHASPTPLSVSAPPKRKRALPWEMASWRTEVGAQPADREDERGDTESGNGTQDTQILSSFT